jgi:hypothetical protein
MISAITKRTPTARLIGRLEMQGAVLESGSARVQCLSQATGVFKTAFRDSRLDPEKWIRDARLRNTIDGGCDIESGMLS